MKNNSRLLPQIRAWIICFVIGLLLSGVTAFPLETELKWLTSVWPEQQSGIYLWLNKVYIALKSTNAQFPYLAYGYDWLAFAHIVIAMVFIGPFINPVRNIWVIQFGFIACAMVFPLAFIAGSVRHIPLYWRLLDCSFGILGSIPLWIIYRKTLKLQKQEADITIQSEIRTGNYYCPLD